VLSAVDPPNVTYKLKLPQKIIDEGLLRCAGAVGASHRLLLSVHR
jgi:hypothetical protein